MTTTRRSSAEKGRIRERIICCLLDDALDHRPIQTAYALSKSVGCTLSYAHAYLARLRVLGLIKDSTLRSPPKLIAHWLDIREEPRPIDYFVPNPPALFTPQPVLRYAVSSFVAESIAYGYLAPSRWDVYVDPADLASWATHLAGHAALRGPGNLRLLLGDPWIAHNPSARLSLASPDGRVPAVRLVTDSRLIVDLLAEGGRAREAAELILKKRGWGGRTPQVKRA